MYVCVCGKSTNKPTTLEWFTAPIYGNCGDGLRRHWGEATDNNMLKFKFKVQLARGGDMGRHGGDNCRCFMRLVRGRLTERLRYVEIWWGLKMEDVGLCCRSWFLAGFTVCLLA